MPTEFGFTSEQTDPLNDLIYLRARYMNPRLGIFGSQDIYEGNIDNTEFNIYSYTDDNPVNRMDPSGQCWDTNAIPKQVEHYVAAWHTYQLSEDVISQSGNI